MTLHVGIDARLVSGSAGGVESVIIGLASGLSQLDDGDERYHFLAYPGNEGWIRPYLKGPCRLLYCPVPLLERVKILAKRFQIVRRDWWWVLRRFLGRYGPGDLPRADMTVRMAGLDLIHFVRQQAFLTEGPSIFHPHDLQHLHLPQYFNPAEIASREYSYRAFCAQAWMVAVTSSWVKNDLLQHYGLSDEKVQIVVWPAVSQAYSTPTAQDISAVKQKYNLFKDFIFYPAQTWPHKNHLNLLEALALLRGRYGLSVPLISSGRLTEFYPNIRRKIRELNLDDQVRFLGFVSPLELQSLYRLCRGVVIPSKFEAASGPLAEAFLASAPSACSNVTSLPAQAGDAALIFDPDQPDSIAEAVRRLWTDEALCKTLVERGARNIARFRWDDCAKSFRAHYRRLTAHPLTSEDRAILAAPPLL